MGQGRTAGSPVRTPGSDNDFPARLTGVSYPAACRAGRPSTSPRRINPRGLQLISQSGQHPVDLAAAEIQDVGTFAPDTGRVLVDVERQPQTLAEASHRVLHPGQRTFEFLTGLPTGLRPPQLGREYGQPAFPSRHESRNLPQQCNHLLFPHTTVMTARLSKPATAVRHSEERTR